ncbi:MAG: crossover junction endodeoxyribonuclease RuvC [Candidatus Marinimicrobia bacterium]|nr:crossover junction endodeoxyribonuclease RuvC [Candidatus Neomarinimicrobiota bacterium]
MGNSIKIIGVDPGVFKTGYGILQVRENRLQYITSGQIITSSKYSFPDRLKTIFNGLTEVIKKWKPNVMAVEQAIYAQNIQTALKMGQARGIVLLAGKLHGLAIEEFSPAKIKVSVVGNGSATKDQVNFMVKRILDLEKSKLDYDESDALAIAICYFNQNKWREG